MRWTLSANAPITGQLSSSQARRLTFTETRPLCQAGVTTEPNAISGAFLRVLIHWTKELSFESIDQAENE